MWGGDENMAVLELGESGTLFGDLNKFTRLTYKLRINYNIVSLFIVIILIILI